MKVETVKVESHDDIQKLFNLYLSERYEGAMVRTNDPYRYSNGGYHSTNLLKLKPTRDAEYKIIGYTVGVKGKTTDAILFVCETDNKINFNVTPAMEIAERTALAKLMASEVSPGVTHFDANYLGKKLIVYFDDLSKDLVPQRARTKGEIRTWD
jgi:ATP-dependent DNA ligase